MSYRIGIDVGGTNTDAVIVDDKLNLISSIKTPTTDDVTTGIFNALSIILEQSKVDKNKISYVMLGTTHCTNAIVERKNLSKVGIIRLAKPATMSIEPMIDWPKDLFEAVNENYYILKGGYEFDGREISPIDIEEIKEVASKLKGTVESIAISSVFSCIKSEHEEKVAEILRQELGDDIPISLSNEIGSLGLLERENATILNAALMKVAKTITSGLKKGLQQEGINNAELYLCQNDGTLMSMEYALKYPVLTIACGPTNSIRGASFLSKKKNAIVLDVGGTTSDVGVIVNSFPRESSLAVEIGGARTNFRMPDLTSIGLGGGTIIREDNGKIKVGPDSVGYKITEKALVFGGDTLTATDIAVRLGIANIGDASKVKHIDIDFAKKAMNQITSLVNAAIDKMKLSDEPVPIIIVGGGSILIGDNIEGASEIIRPNNHAVANALGSAIAQISGEIEKIFTLNEISRDEAVKIAKKTAIGEAVKAGADPSTIDIVDMEDVPLAYHPGNATRIRVKAAGDLKHS
jgi:N-methylhydantoinase A/oxoprolinase/acetone carboxylase beta subunit